MSRLLAEELLRDLDVFDVPEYILIWSELLAMICRDGQSYVHKGAQSA